jgi:hypothetical protein
VDLGPVQPEHPDEQQLDQPVPAEHVQGQLLPAAGEPTPPRGSYSTSPASPERP